MPATEQPDGYMLRCLAHGADPAARYAPDLRAAEEATRAAPPIATVAADSRPSAELAVYVGVINGTNSGCMSCIGAQLT